MNTVSSVEEETRIRKYRPFAFPTQPGTGRYHVAPYDCCKQGELDICFDSIFCPCCLLAKLQSNVDFAKNNSRLYEETSSSSDDDDNARNSELSRYERRFSSHRSFYDCETCVQTGLACLPLSLISTMCVFEVVDHMDSIKAFNVKPPFGDDRNKEQRTPKHFFSVYLGGEGGKCCDCLMFIGCAYAFLGTTCTPLHASFYARELRHRQLYDGGCFSAATPQVPSRGWLRRRNVQLVKEHGKTRMKLALDIFRVAWFVSRFLPKLKNRYQFFDENLEIPQMV